MVLLEIGSFNEMHLTVVGSCTVALLGGHISMHY